jgi:heme/copper-type cytochrome/quinol oxidase subunit 2
MDQRIGPGSYWSAKRVAQLIAFVLATVAGIAVLFTPSYTTATSDSNGNQTIGSSTVWEVNGPISLLLVAIPIAITILPLLVRGPAWSAVSVIATVLIGLFAVIGSFTIGFYFIPAVAAELVAVFLPSRLPAAHRASTV